MNLTGEVKKKGSTEEETTEVKTGLFASRRGLGANLFSRRAKSTEEKIEPEKEEESEDALPDVSSVFDDDDDNDDLFAPETDSNDETESKDDDADESKESLASMLFEDSEDEPTPNEDNTITEEVPVASDDSLTENNETVGEEAQTSNEEESSTDSLSTAKDLVFNTFFNANNDNEISNESASNEAAPAEHTLSPEPEPEDPNVKLLKERVIASPFSSQELPECAPVTPTFADAIEVKYVCDIESTLAYVYGIEDNVGATLSVEAYGTVKDIMIQSDTHEIVTFDGIEFFSNKEKTINQRLFSGIVKNMVSSLNTYGTYSLPMVKRFHFIMNNTNYQIVALSVNTYEFNYLCKVAASLNASVSIKEINGKAVLYANKE